MDTRFVVLGSGYAGTLAAIRLARRARPVAAVTLVDPELALVERVRLHEALVHGREVAHPLTDLTRGLPITLVRGRAVGLEEGHVVLDDGRRVAFDQCVVATGSRIARTVPGSIEHARVVEAGTVRALREELARASRVLVLGGGLTGIEIVAEIAEARPACAVTLVTRELAPSLTSRARAYVERTLRRLGVEIVSGAADRLESGTARVGERAFSFDLAIDTTGFASEVPAFLAGYPRDASGRVLTDAALRARPGVILAGDLAAPEGTLAGAPMIRGCQSAMPSGAHAADVAWACASGRPARPFAFVPNGYCVSLGRRDGVVDAYGMVWTGRAAAWLKERIVRYTMSSMHWQARGWDYRWRPFVRLARPALPAPRARALAETSA